MDSLLDKNLITTREASELSGYHSDYLGRLCREGKISGSRVGRSWVIDRSSILRFVEEQELQKKKNAEELAHSREEKYMSLCIPMEEHRIQTACPYRRESAYFLAHNPSLVFSGRRYKFIHRHPNDLFFLWPPKIDALFKLCATFLPIGKFNDHSTKRRAYPSLFRISFFERNF
jgi:excisionase family DNA binding protein